MREALLRIRNSSKTILFLIIVRTHHVLECIKDTLSERSGLVKTIGLCAQHGGHGDGFKVPCTCGPC